MKCRIGLLGLPNVGKSSLFNALAQQSIAAAANFPFCTIDPNIAPIAVPDEYLDSLAIVANSQMKRRATMEWIDVAGLAPNAHRGEGLGNQFLGTLRECHALCHVVRVFENIQGNNNNNNSNNMKEDTVIHHVTGCIDPIQDVQLIQLELTMADLEHVQRRLAKTTCEGKERQTLERILVQLEAGVPARTLELSPEEHRSIKGMGLLTIKPVLYAFNVDEVDFTLGRAQADERIRNEILPQLSQHCHGSSSNVTKDMYALVSAKLEAELYERLPDPQERYDYLSSEIGMADDATIQSVQDMEKLFSYNILPNKMKELLNLALVYTGPGVPPERSRTTKAHLFSPSQEVWTANDLAGRLHGEIQRGFIRAEVISAPELLQFDNLAAAREAGRVRTEGRNYFIAPNDVVLVRWK